MRRGLDKENIVYLSLLVISLDVLIRWYQNSCAVIEVSNIVCRSMDCNVQVVYICRGRVHM